ncbi:hypothetical protein SARC_01684 [Sphaeroforma arctica JP610]|uniref:Vta1 C-terminal domain-containing protein n=1 Tax=Sphaeroforma arctica JP610 TaxID=667725 RepID=A0A0L0GD47_9EUKA|nr:hypothetical protein SARC_01684 [Sphaeroforma arctica JP610]KNC86158.1 hypothetical protein SARC_01684 [Sphaeroforma arctica JP610]|eukprot:XP_014160060.1 hypothetical protein SARC_01684 [Sphaeroforma arctica JP610]
MRLQEKSNLKGIKEISDQDVGKAHFERITLNLFDEADVEDRSGLSTKATVKKFLVAGNLLEAMATFGPLSESIDEKRLYCKSKMVEMLKALKAGLPLSTGPPADGQSIDLTQPDHMQVDAPSINTKQTRQDEFGLPGPPPPEDDTPMNTHPGSLPPPPNTNDRATSPSSGLPQIPNHIPPSVKPGPSVTRSSKPKGFAGPPGTAKDVEDVSAEDMKRVNKLCRFCMSALMYDDVETAVSNLQEALALLTE